MKWIYKCSKWIEWDEYNAYEGGMRTSGFEQESTVYEGARNGHKEGKGEGSNLMGLWNVGCSAWKTEINDHGEDENKMIMEQDRWSWEESHRACAKIRM